MSTSTASTKKAGLIFLHGLGDGPWGWSSLAQQLPSLIPRLSQVEYVFPQSPEIPISINGGMRMPGWFDLYEWPISVGDPDDKKGKLASVQQMETEIEKLVQKGIPRNKIAVGGFSQGGAVALLTAYYSNPPEHVARPPVAACVALSGWLTLTKEMVVHVANAQTPLFWAHGQYDDKVLFEQQRFGIQKLQAGGVTNITQFTYPMGHESRPDEIRQLAKFLDQVLFQDQDSSSSSAAAGSGDL